MRRSELAMAIVICCSMVCWSQAYYEASGRTAVFTLAAGAKSEPSEIRATPNVHAPINTAIRVTGTEGGIEVSLPELSRGFAYVSFCNIAGRSIYRYRSCGAESRRFETRTFKPGVYAVMIRIDGKIYSRRFTIAAKGE